MKAYQDDKGTFFAPGTQPKGASKLDIPTDTQGLVAFLNDLVACTRAYDAETARRAEVEQDLEKRVEAFQEARGRQPHPFAVEMGRKQLQEAAEAPRITDEAFEALPLPYQLHLAALAVENARSKVR